MSGENLRIAFAKSAAKCGTNFHLSEIRNTGDVATHAMGWLARSFMFAAHHLSKNSNYGKNLPERLFYHEAAHVVLGQKAGDFHVDNLVMFNDKSRGSAAYVLSSYHPLEFASLEDAMTSFEKRIDYASAGYVCESVMGIGVARELMKNTGDELEIMNLAENYIELTCLRDDYDGTKPEVEDIITQSIERTTAFLTENWTTVERIAETAKQSPVLLESHLKKIGLNAELH